VVTVCSPLQDYPLERLPKIVADPYDPPPKGSDERHQGVDFTYHRLAGVDIPIWGVKVQAVLPGVVAASVVESFPFGNLVIIETPLASLPPELAERLGIAAGESLYVMYGHMDGPPPVSLGQAVSGCQIIGAVGKSGNTEAPHLHLETRIGPAGAAFAEKSYYREEDTLEATSNDRLWRTSGVFRHFDPMALLTGD